MSEKLLYALADVFGTNVYEVETGLYRACVRREFKIDTHWTVENDVTLCVDENTDKLLTAFAHIRKKLWAYVVITEAGRWLLFFDNDHAKIRPGAEKSFGHGNGMGTLKRLKPAITGALSFIGNKWVAADPKELVEGL